MRAEQSAAVQYIYVLDSLHCACRGQALLHIYVQLAYAVLDVMYAPVSVHILARSSGERTGTHRIGVDRARTLSLDVVDARTASVSFLFFYWFFLCPLRLLLPALAFLLFSSSALPCSLSL